mmetsp:Transcript_19177/g.29369  ORF Transcript_19177/g.29369 Transcript_19177/m.29369 type:complete len:133 (+) Transcript_19177:203-601(+)
MTEASLTQAYDITYKLTYFVFSKEWKEEGIKEQIHKSQPANFQYSYQAEKQEVVLEVTLTPKAKGKDIQRTFAPTKAGNMNDFFVDEVDASGPKEDDNAIKLKVAFHLHEALQCQFMKQRINSLSRKEDFEE